MVGTRIGLSIALLATLAISGRAGAVNLLPDRCLEKLEQDTKAWSECGHQFSKSDDRCKLAKNAMAKRMDECARKGHSKTQIDQAMKRGYRSAGEPKKK